MGHAHTLIADQVEPLPALALRAANGAGVGVRGRAMGRERRAGVSEVDHLARRAKAGDRAAFGALMTAHKQELHRFVRRRVADDEDAYDIVQEAFVSAWLAIDRYDPARPFVVWLRAIALNKCRDYARRAKVRRSAVEAMRMVDWVGAEATAPEQEEAAAAREELQLLVRALDALPAHLREALMLTTVDALSQQEAAIQLGVSVKAVEYRVARARQILARRLGRDAT